MFGLLRIAIFLVFAGIIAFGIYYVLYTIIVNRRIERGIVTEGRLFDTSKALMVVTIAVLLLLLVANRMAANDPTQTTRNSFSVVNVSDPEKLHISATANRDVDDDVSYVSLFSEEENPGYTKNVIVDGDFTFTVFTRSGAADAYHPDFLCFVEYTGDAGDDVSFYETFGFESPKDDGRTWSGGSGGASIPEKLLYIGNLDEDCAFVATICTLDEEAEAAYNAADEQAIKDAKGEFPEWSDFAEEVSEVRITL